MGWTRRTFLFSGFWLAGRVGLAWPKAKPDAPARLEQAIAAETAGQQPAESGQVSLEAPDIAEDGAIVPVTVSSDLPDVDSVWIFVEKNPTPLAARFELAPALDPFVSLRVKMNESCEIVAVVRSGDAYFSARKPVRVVLGGCG
jgi:sulfur-oxidizing protein SoxY